MIMIPTCQDKTHELNHSLKFIWLRKAISTHSNMQNHVSFRSDEIDDQIKNQNHSPQLLIKVMKKIK